MALWDEPVSRSLFYTWSIGPWGSPLLASSAGTSAWLHGTDPAWWQLPALYMEPESFWAPAVLEATRAYREQATQAVESTPRPVEPTGDVRRQCEQECFDPRVLHRSACIAECMEKGPGKHNFGRKGLLQVEWFRAAVPYVLAVGLVLLGAYAIVRGD